MIPNKKGIIIQFDNNFYNEQKAKDNLDEFCSQYDEFYIPGYDDIISYFLPSKNLKEDLQNLRYIFYEMLEYPDEMVRFSIYIRPHSNILPEHYRYNIATYNFRKVRIEYGEISSWEFDEEE